MNDADRNTSIPHQTYLSLFLSFLKFGFLAWGGPVAQIDMIRHELVDEEGWVSSERFNRVLAVYQALPGPEAHELCVYFGLIARGRIGGFLGGLGFMLPGFLLMLALSWFYVSIGIGSPIFQSVFLGMQPAVGALIVRAVYRIGGHALHEDRWLWAVAGIAAVAQLLGVNFLVTLIAAGLIYAFHRNRSVALVFIITFGVFLAWWGFSSSADLLAPNASTIETHSASLPVLAWSGLKGGLLTFGGAYTVIPFLRQDAVQIGMWMTEAQFLDGLALSSLLPAPLIIFSTFVGYIGGGFWGAVVITLAIFTPAFGFTLLGHDALEKLVENRSAHAFLDGVTAGVIGLISATALGILSQTVVSLHAWVVFGAALLFLFRSKVKWTVAAVILGAGLYGLLFL